MNLDENWIANTTCYACEEKGHIAKFYGNPHSNYQWPPSQKGY